jgi:hypothetical protein
MEESTTFPARSPNELDSSRFDRLAVFPPISPVIFQPLYRVLIVRLSSVKSGLKREVERVFRREIRENQLGTLKEE